MVSRASALASNYIIGSKKFDEKITLTFQEIRDLNIKQIAAWPSTIEIIDSKLANIINVKYAPGFNKVLSSNNNHILRIEPLKWWILNSDIPILSTEEATTLDLSDSFTCLEIQGEKSVIFLNKFLPLDLRENSFSLDCFASSIIHHVSIKLRRTKNSYQLFIPRGFALSLWEIFLESASQFNYEVR